MYNALKCCPLLKSVLSVARTSHEQLIANLQHFPSHFFEIMQIDARRHQHGVFRTLGHGGEGSGERLFRGGLA